MQHHLRGILRGGGALGVLLGRVLSGCRLEVLRDEIIRQRKPENPAGPPSKSLIGLQADQLPTAFTRFNLQYLLCPPPTAAACQGLNLFCCLVRFLFYCDALRVFFLPLVISPTCLTAPPPTRRPGTPACFWFVWSS